jgi:hypothetical protein
VISRTTIVFCSCYYYFNHQARDRDRTGDLTLTKGVLYLLSYASDVRALHLFTARSPLAYRSFIRQAGDGARTRDIKLGRLALYQLSYSREKISSHPDYLLPVAASRLLLRTAERLSYISASRCTSTTVLLCRNCRRAMLISLRPPTDGGGRIRTFVGVSRQIYSLLPLAAWVPHPFPAQCDPTPVTPLTRHVDETEHPTRADGENRTRNRLITNQVLCQLSYVSVSSDQRTAFLRKTHRITGV